MPTTQSSRTTSSEVAKPTLGNRLSWIGSRLISVVLFLAAGVTLIALLGLAQRIGWIRSEFVPAEPATTGAGSETTYTCPMHPNIRQPTKGRCPICGMELVPASAASDALSDEFAIHIESAQRRLANIETDEVRSEPLSARLRTVGSIAIDESRQATIAAYVDGRLERLFADYTGVQINKGDHLAVIYSPQLFGAQAEYLEALRALNATTGGLAAIRKAQDALVANTLHRLREFGMTDEQLRQLELDGNPQSRLTIYSPQGGTVVEKLAVEGMYVNAGDPIYRIAELSTVWLMLKLYPEDAAMVRFGQRVEATVQSLPGETFVGRVAFIDPTVSATNRTVAVRVELNNERGRLRPGDYAGAMIELPIGPQGDIYDSDLAGKWISPMHPQIIRDEPGKCPICGMDLIPTSEFGYASAPAPQPESVYVPRSAVLLAGGNSVVYVETEAGRFELRPVSIGPILEDKIVILEGLKPGEQVATSGNFLIDSQMQLSGRPSLIDPARATAGPVKREGPLEFSNVTITTVAGEGGQRLEELYAAYFKVQAALASDQNPPAEIAHELAETASELRTMESLPMRSRKLVETITKEAEHLHHMDLDAARKAFKSISHSVVTMATQVRGDSSEEYFTHFFCPMVPGGGGDWLQRGGELRNPYFGSQMLRCGEKVAEYAPSTKQPADAKPQQDDSNHAATEDE